MAKKYDAYEMQLYPHLNAVIKCDKCSFHAIGAQWENGECPLCKNLHKDSVEIQKHKKVK